LREEKTLLKLKGLKRKIWNRKCGTGSVLELEFSLKERKKFPFFTTTFLENKKKAQAIEAREEIFR
jgi:hypothetical protein